MLELLWLLLMTALAWVRPRQDLVLEHLLLRHQLAVVERVIGTFRRERPDRVLVLDEQHLVAVLAGIVRSDNQDRPHRTLGLQPPELRPRPVTGPIRSRPVLNGLHHAYERAA